MQIMVESRDEDSASVREASTVRVRFVLRRLSTWVTRAKVQFSDVNGPRGGVDKQCMVELKTDHMGSIVASAMARNWRAALDHSLARASKSLTRSMRRATRPARTRDAKLLFTTSL